MRGLRMVLVGGLVLAAAACAKSAEEPATAQEELAVESEASAEQPVPEAASGEEPEVAEVEEEPYEGPFRTDRDGTAERDAGPHFGSAVRLNEGEGSWGALGGEDQVDGYVFLVQPGRELRLRVSVAPESSSSVHVVLHEPGGRVLHANASSSFNPGQIQETGWIIAEDAPEGDYLLWVRATDYARYELMMTKRAVEAAAE